MVHLDHFFCCCFTYVCAAIMLGVKLDHWIEILSFLDHVWIVIIRYTFLFYCFQNSSYILVIVLLFLIQLQLIVFDLNNLIKSNDPHESLLLRCSIQSEQLIRSLQLEHVAEGFPAIISQYMFVLCFRWLSTIHYISKLYYVIL